MNMGDGSNSGANAGHGSSFSYGGSSGGGTNWSIGGSSHGRFSSGTSDNRGRSRSEGTTNGTCQGFTEQMDYLLEPGAFSRMLRTGGPFNGNRVTAVWFQAGRRFDASGGNAMLAEFKQ
jgi:hypothetical protein